MPGYGNDEARIWHLSDVHAELPFISSIATPAYHAKMPCLAGRVPEWTKGADCKSAIRGFESHRDLLTQSADALPSTRHATTHPGNSLSNP